MKKTYLNIPWAMKEFAETRGARRERTTGRWFVLGEVPAELQEFIPQPNRTREPEQVPECPKCGSLMRQRHKKMDNSPFWGCRNYPKCSGFREWSCDPVIPFIDVAVRALYPSSDTTTVRQPSIEKKENATALKIRRAHILQMAASLFGIEHLERWVKTPSDEFMGKSPSQLLATRDGCIQVEKLLKQLQAKK